MLCNSSAAFMGHTLSNVVFSFVSKASWAACFKHYADFLAYAHATAGLFPEHLARPISHLNA